MNVIVEPYTVVTRVRIMRKKKWILKADASHFFSPISLDDLLLISVVGMNHND